ncbi:MAG TPA: UbiD family decarboxylase [Xanthobacteraceae bacterium]|jgi:4-hydroxy-3-polyprenylbenzoate decarboxylase|nr:UbiD family decarboxylase [Xanthobacteraceae bacterium]
MSEASGSATVERTPVAFGDLRGWLSALDKAGELKRIDAEVDWDVELGTIARLAQGTADGPALLFNNIRDYGANARCRSVFTGALASYRRLALLLGLPADTHPRQLVKLGRSVLGGAIAPKVVSTGPVKENILKGDDIDLYEFPVPQWNRVDGGRYILTYGGVVTMDPDSKVMNVGVYRGMVGGKNLIPILMWRAQHIGHHATAWQAKGFKEMPIAVAIGWEPSLDFVGGSPVSKGVCEYDVVGAIRGAPVELVKCETNDLYVPATSEIVIEGMLSFDPDTFVMEGPFAEFTGYVAGDKSPKPAIRVTCITHRKDPILRGTIEGSMPGSYAENGVCSSVMRAAAAWNVLDRAGVPGITDVWCPPVQTGINIVVQIKQSYRNQAKQVANALWGSSAAHVRYKHVTVVDDDIDIHDYAAVDWAIAHRVNAGEDDIVIMPSTFGAGLDPSTRRRDRNVMQFGTGKWNRVLIDATINLDYDPDPDLGGARFPPTVWPAQSDIDAVRKRWDELGLAKK